MLLGQEVTIEDDGVNTLIVPPLRDDAPGIEKAQTEERGDI